MGNVLFAGNYGVATIQRGSGLAKNFVCACENVFDGKGFSDGRSRFERNLKQQPITTWHENIASY